MRVHRDSASGLEHGGPTGGRPLRRDARNDAADQPDRYHRPFTVYRLPFTLLPYSMPSSPQTALITGATQGIGRATAFALGRARLRVGVCALTEAKVRRVVEELKAQGIEAAGATADVGHPEHAPRAAEEIARALGEIGGLLN